MESGTLGDEVVLDVFREGTGLYVFGSTSTPVDLLVPVPRLEAGVLKEPTLERLVLGGRVEVLLLEAGGLVVRVDWDEIFCGLVLRLALDFTDEVDLPMEEDDFGRLVVVRLGMLWLLLGLEEVTVLAGVEDRVLFEVWGALVAVERLVVREELSWVLFPACPSAVWSASPNPVARMIKNRNLLYMAFPPFLFRWRLHSIKEQSAGSGSDPACGVLPRFPICVPLGSSIERKGPDPFYTVF